MAIKVGFVSLGCPKNLINTEMMIAKCSEAGYEIVAEDIDADVMVVNTCAFIQSAKQEAIDNILDITWLKENHGLKGIVVTGCLAERYREEILTELPEVDCVLGTGSFDEIVSAVEKAYKKTQYISFGDPCKTALGGDRVITTPDYFAYVQIAEGCDNHCTYCVIPSLRGKYRSRELSEIAEEVRGLASMGIKEICLIAQDTTRYGEDLYGTPCLDGLIHELSEIDGIKWIRVLYCYPERVTEGLIEEFASNPKLVKYIDIPIQHINADILRRMNRRGGADTVKKVINRLREKVPGIVIRTTVIVGFPGETDEQYNELLDFVKATKFERLGAFEYSREENTPAYDMPDQVSEKVKKKRRDGIMREQKLIHKAHNNSRVGSVVEVICEGYDKVAERFYGRTASDCPEIDGKVYFISSRNISDGTFVNVKIDGVMDYDLTGVAVFQS